MINYNDLAKEYFHNLFFVDADNFKHRQVQSDMEEEHGDEFNMDSFIAALDYVEKEIYKAMENIK